MLIENNATGTTLQLTLKQKDDWVKYISLAADYGFYHTWHYHAMATSGRPILLVYCEARNFVAMPLLERAIQDTPYYDLHCVCGYTGPVSNLKFADMSDGLKRNFLSAFSAFLFKGSYVSVFSRLHPFFDQNTLFEKTDGIYQNGKTVAINLAQSIEEQRKQYRQTTRDCIKKCRMLGYVSVEASSKEDIAAFTKLYQSNMNRTSNTDFYLFTEEYFTKLVHATEFDCKLILVYLNDDLVCGSIIIYTKGIIEGPLIVTNAKYLKNSPAKFLVDEISELGRKWKMKYYHLGGGLGYKEDSLFEWKQGFSNMVLNCCNWRFIANKAVYNQLVEKSGNQIHSDVDFFPLYRMIPQ